MTATPDLAPDQYAELVPLQRSIADTIRTTRVAWGDVDGLATSIAVAVAVYMGPLVGPVPAEMAALREQVEQARRIAVALEEESAEALRLLNLGFHGAARTLLAGEL